MIDGMIVRFCSWVMTKLTQYRGGDDGDDDTDFPRKFPLKLTNRKKVYILLTSTIWVIYDVMLIFIRACANVRHHEMRLTYLIIV